MNRDERAAVDLKHLLIELSPLLEEMTADVCPGCRDVCCKQKRCVPDPIDIRYMTALGQSFPEYDARRPPDGPCQFMARFGCTMPRWFRPWRCTWYFCDPLLAAMNAGPQRQARRIAELTQKILDIRSAW